jgi:tRNA (cmo5U34)-methyltransferase
MEDVCSGLDANNSRFKGNLNEYSGLFYSAWPYREILLDNLVRVLCPVGEERCGSFLEIGPGAGELAERVLELEEKSHMTLVDYDPFVMLNLKKKLDKYKKRTDFVLADALDFMRQAKDDTFDVVYSSWVIHNFDVNQRERLLSNIYRVLKPGGFFVDLDKYVPDSLREETELFQMHLGRINALDFKGHEDVRQALILHEKEDRLPKYKMKRAESLIEMNIAEFKNARFLMKRERDAIMVGYKGYELIRDARIS